MAVLHIDTTDFTRFARGLMRAAPELRATFLLGLRGVAEEVAGEARARVEPYSASIPDSIKVRVKGTSVAVEAGPAVRGGTSALWAGAGAGQTPLAGLFELGNQGGGRSDVFRHPVFGNADVWVEQPMHRFLAPALAAKEDRIDAIAEAAIDAVWDFKEV